MVARVRTRLLMVLCILIPCPVVRSSDAIRLQFHPEMGREQTLRATWRRATSYQSPSGPALMENIKTYTLEFEPIAATEDQGATLRIRIKRIVEDSIHYINGQEDPIWQWDSSDCEKHNVSLGKFVAFLGESFTADFSPRGQLLDLDTADFFAGTAGNRLKHEDQAIRHQPNQDKAEREIKALNDKYGSARERQLAYEKAAPTLLYYGAAELRRWLDHAMVPLPADSVRPGDSWKAPVRIFLEGPMEMVGTHSLQEVTDDTITIQVEAQRTLDDKPKPCPDGYLRAKKFAGTYRAKLVVDRHSGWLRSREAEMNLTGSLALPQHPAAGPDGTVPVTTQATVTVETVD